MELTLKGGYVFENGHFETKDITVSFSVSPFAESVVDISGKYVFPGFADVHVLLVVGKHSALVFVLIYHGVL